MRGEEDDERRVSKSKSGRMRMQSEGEDNAVRLIRLESVELDGLLVDTFLNEHSKDLGPLVSLKLDNLSTFLVIYDRSIASELLLECLEKLLGIVLGGNSLEGSDSFTSVSLLNTDVNVLGSSLLDYSSGRCRAFFFVSKSVIRLV